MQQQHMCSKADSIIACLQGNASLCILHKADTADTLSETLEVLCSIVRRMTAGLAEE